MIKKRKKCDKNKNVKAFFTSMIQRISICDNF